MNNYVWIINYKLIHLFFCRFNWSQRFQRFRHYRYLHRFWIYHHILRGYYCCYYKMCTKDAQTKDGRVNEGTQGKFLSIKWRRITSQISGRQHPQRILGWLNDIGEWFRTSSFDSENPGKKYSACRVHWKRTVWWSLACGGTLNA